MQFILKKFNKSVHHSANLIPASENKTLYIKNHKLKENNKAKS